MGGMGDARDTELERALARLAEYLGGSDGRTRPESPVDRGGGESKTAPRAALAASRFEQPINAVPRIPRRASFHHASQQTGRSRHRQGSTVQVTGWIIFGLTLGISSVVAYM